MAKQPNMSLAELQRANDDPPQTTAVQVIEQHEPTPMALIAQAVQLGFEPAKLNALMDFQERCEQNAARKAFARAMADCQSEMPTVVKDAQGDKGKFARLETLQQAIKPVYLRHGFSITISEAEPSRPDYLRVQCVVRHRDGHCETYFREAPPDVNGPKGNPVKTVLQGSQSSVSYLRRNLLAEIFGITVAGQDIDGANQASAIGPGQIAELTRLIEESGADTLAFLRMMNCETLDAMPIAVYAVAETQLKMKIAARRQKVGA